MAGKRQCVAVDTNVLLDLANKAEPDYGATALELKACDVEMPVIATPREIVSKFF